MTPRIHAVALVASLLATTAIMLDPLSPTAQDTVTPYPLDILLMRSKDAPTAIICTIAQAPLNSIITVFRAAVFLAVWWYDAARTLGPF